MSWFLVLLFWSPVLQGYDVADGWGPLSMKSEVFCESRLEIIKEYLPRYTADYPHVVDCIKSTDPWTAIATAKDNANE